MVGCCEHAPLNQKSPAKAEDFVSSQRLPEGSLNLYVRPDRSGDVQGHSALALAVRHKADSGEPQDHHGPSRRLWDGRDRRL